MCNEKNNKDIVISFRIDSEIQDLICFLKTRKVRYTDMVRESMKEVLLNKCKELKYIESKEYCPF